MYGSRLLIYLIGAFTSPPQEVHIYKLAITTLDPFNLVQYSFVAFLQRIIIILTLLLNDK